MTDVSLKASQREAMRGLRLDSLLLWETSVRRGEGDAESVGRVSAEVHFATNVAEDQSEVAYFVTGEFAFTDASDDEIVFVAVTYVANYENEQLNEIDDQLIQAFSKSVLMHVTPFQREYLATITNRLGLPPFFIPLLRKRDINLEKE